MTIQPSRFIPSWLAALTPSSADASPWRAGRARRKLTGGGPGTAIYLDKVYSNGQLVEETRDYLAQHKNGDVWYFGEDVDNFLNGNLLDHSGSFIHGKDGAKAGIWMKAEQRVGDT
jgi:hypothetical protein